MSYPEKQQRSHWVRATFESSGNELPTHTYVAMGAMARTQRHARSGGQPWYYGVAVVPPRGDLILYVCVIGFSKSMHYGIVKVNTEFQVIGTDDKV